MAKRVPDSIERNAADNYAMARSQWRSNLHENASR